MNARHIGFELDLVIDSDAKSGSACIGDAAVPPAVEGG
jgi:hypothetical protein